MSSIDPVTQGSDGRSHMLGVCWIVYGAFRVVMAVCLFIYGGTATLMFGALLNRVPNPFALMDIFHSLYIAMIALSAVCGVVGFLAGLALVGGQRSGRTFALIAGFLSLCDIPLGITLGIYTLMELLPIRTGKFSGRSGQTA
jgi:hypothetical protein